jgi:hypothetical protein
MKFNVRIAFASVIIIAACVAAGVNGCKDTGSTEPSISDTTRANQQMQLAYESLENQFQFWFNNNLHSASDYDQLNFQLANAAYKQALQYNPTSAEAHFGAAITEILCAYADTAINNTIKRWQGTSGASSAGLAMDGGIPLATRSFSPPLLQASVNIVEMYKLALNDPPLISELQALIRDRLLPRVNYAIGQLASVEIDTTFRYRISGKMQGDADLQPVYLYVTEAFLTDAGLQATKFLLEQFLVYRFDLPDYTQASLLEALRQENTTFFVLAPDGAAHSQNAKSSFDSMLDKISNGIHFLETFSGSRNDAAVKLADIKRQDLDSAKVYIQKAQSSMHVPQSILLRDADSDGNDYTVQIHLAAFFDNPPQYPKSQLFPQYTVAPSGPKNVDLQFVAQSYGEFTFPDPTFRGMFPGLSNETLKRILRIDEEFGYDLRLYAYDEGLYTPITNATVRLQTPAQSYSRTTDESGYARILILDQDQVSYRLFINHGSGEVELQASQPFLIRAKVRDYQTIFIPQQPTGLVLQRIASPLAIQLTWSPSNFGNIAIQRSVGSGSNPVDLDSTYAGGVYTDYGVAAGQTYRYRVRTWRGSFNFWGLYPKDNFYSNIAEIVP